MTPLIGVYEKALDTRGSVEDLLVGAAKAGYDFLELSVDAAPRRLARLEWSTRRRMEVAAAVRRTGVPIGCIMLSGHRRYPLGSRDAGTRRRALDILERGIALAADLGAGIVQLAGYFVVDEVRDGGERRRFVEGLERGVRWAAGAGVRLGLENVDGDDVTSLVTAVGLVREVDSPWLSVYADVGNLAGNGLDVCAELAIARGQILAVQLKDARSGEFRRVPFGEGIVPFDDVFPLLAQLGFAGPYAVEMWNDGTDDPGAVAAEACAWVAARIVIPGSGAALTSGIRSPIFE